MIRALFTGLKNIVFPFLKIDGTQPTIPAGHEHDKHLQVIRADAQYWNFVLLMLCVYAGGWILGMCVFGISVLLAAPALIWLVIPVLIFACIKMLVVLAVHRIDYELRWYIITDTSITVREGAWTVQEITASYQNIQNVRVTQGPVERLFGFANVRIDTAGSGASQHKGEGISGHHAVLRGVTNAQQIRDTILANLKAYRNAGLGDPDDIHTHPITPTHNSRMDVLEDILKEVSAIKTTLIQQ